VTKTTSSAPRTPSSSSVASAARTELPHSLLPPPLTNVPRMVSRSVSARRISRRPFRLSGRACLQLRSSTGRTSRRRRSVSMRQCTRTMCIVLSVVIRPRGPVAPARRAMVTRVRSLSSPLLESLVLVRFPHLHLVLGHTRFLPCGTPPSRASALLLPAHLRLLCFQ
jgi:hypothetical protein